MLNPVNKNGQTSWSIVCNSKMHWASNFPHNPQSVNILEDELDDCEKENIVLIIEDLDKSKTFVVGTSKAEPINTVCTKPVEKWYKNFRNNLPNDFKANIENLPSKTVFTFWDRRKVTFLKRILFPVVTENKCKINAEIIK